jgi:hypothetical protein
MAITSMDGVIAAMPGQHLNVSRYMTGAAKGIGTFYSLGGLSAATGFPGTPSYPSASLAWSIPAGTGIPFTNPPTGSSYLAQFSCAGSNHGTVYLYDRLAQTGAITPGASTQNLTTTALTRPNAAGDDVELWFEWISASSGTASNFSASYTNQSDVSGRITPVLTAQTASVPGQMQPLKMASSDNAIKTVESFTSSGAIGGTGMLVLLRRIAVIAIQQPYCTVSLDLFNTGMPQIYDSACLSLVWMPAAGTAATSFQTKMQIISG